eukprot:TRINITY_DN22400_c0_g1_i1.p1 TRINITY_DN22400_c0_g1~~TRINITY_DN22400_c0_g1_i1.p1  ORF type:complete len:182 (-),score=26.49 TRINITY_DN22400_c0_g1_i1:165-710(-)
MSSQWHMYGVPQSIKRRRPLPLRRSASASVDEVRYRVSPRGTMSSNLCPSFYKPEQQDPFGEMLSPRSVIRYRRASPGMPCLQMKKEVERVRYGTHVQAKRDEPSYGGASMSNFRDYTEDLKASHPTSKSAGYCMIGSRAPLHWHRAMTRPDRLSLEMPKESFVFKERSKSSLARECSLTM